MAMTRFFPPAANSNLSLKSALIGLLPKNALVIAAASLVPA
jgi:hypothetical protein